MRQRQTKLFHTYEPVPDTYQGEPALLLHILRELSLTPYWQWQLTSTKSHSGDDQPRRAFFKVSGWVFVKAGTGKYHHITLRDEIIVLSGCGPFKLADPNCFAALAAAIDSGVFDKQSWNNYVCRANPQFASLVDRYRQRHCGEAK